MGWLDRSQMTPIAPPENPAYMRLRYSAIRRYSVLGHAFGAHLEHGTYRSFRKFVAAIKHAARYPFDVYGAPLAFGICHVFRMCAREQMTWVYAYRVVAAMTYLKFWQIPEMKEIGSAMREHRAAVAVSERSITIARNCSGPRPARVVGADCYFAPKHFVHGQATRRARTSSGAKPARWVDSLEAFVALLADEVNWFAGHRSALYLKVGG